LVGYSNLENTGIPKPKGYHDINAENAFYNSFVKDKYNIELIL
jgi:hypothetical protein